MLSLEKSAAHRLYYWRFLKSAAYGFIRRLTGRKCRLYPVLEPFVKGQLGLEVGGPSPHFRKGCVIPVYDRCKAIDFCNFSDNTIWHPANAFSSIMVRRQFVAEATNLTGVRDETYDFVLASHVLEHVANPLQALLEWKRVLRCDGLLLVIVPDKRGTFDHQRPYTEFRHIEADFKANQAESDSTHLAEVVALHDIRLDPDAGSLEHFRARCLNNATVRALHHHVFSPEVLTQMLSRAGMKILGIAIERPFHLIAIARRLSRDCEPSAESDNLAFLSEKAEWRQHDPLVAF